MKVLVRTEGLEGYEIFTEVNLSCTAPPPTVYLPDMNSLNKFHFTYSITTAKTPHIAQHAFELVGRADGMPYYRRKE